MLVSPKRPTSATNLTTLVLSIFTVFVLSVLEVSGRTKNELVSIGFDLTKMTRADYERLKRDRDDDNNDRDNNNGDKSSRVRFMRKLSWSHKAPSLDILDQTQIRLGGRGSKKKR